MINNNMTGELQLTALNTVVQVQSSTAAKYVHLHAARLLCQLFIHWEFLPFLPVSCVQPSGLTTEQTQHYSPRDAPPGFWLSSARACFKAARHILDFALLVEHHISPVDSAFMSYAIFVATFVEIYGHSFPWMDTERQLASSAAMSAMSVGMYTPSHFSYGTARSQPSGLQKEVTIVRLNDEWSATLASIAAYFEGFKLDYYTNTLTDPCLAPDSYTSLLRSRRCLRDGGVGEGLEEYALLQPRLRNFGRV